MNHIHLVVGDPFLAEEKGKTLIKQIESSVKGTIQQTKYRLSENSLDQVLTEARNLPFLTDAQIFYLRDADALKEKHVEVLASYLKSPSPTSYFIFEAGALDRRTAFAKLMEKHGQVHVLDARDKKSEGARFIRQKLKNSGKTIAPIALSRLQEQARDVPVVLDSLIDQLVTYAGASPQITEEMVEKFEEKWQEIDVFQLVNAIAGKQSGQALLYLKHLLEDIGDMISLLGILHWQIRRLWLAKTLLEEGQSEGDVLRRCRVSPRQAPYFREQVRRFSRKKLESALEGLFQLDWKTKTGRADGMIEMEKWVVTVTS